MCSFDLPSIPGDRLKPPPVSIKPGERKIIKLTNKNKSSDGAQNTVTSPCTKTGVICLSSTASKSLSDIHINTPVFKPKLEECKDKPEVVTTEVTSTGTTVIKSKDSTTITKIVPSRTTGDSQTKGLKLRRPSSTATSPVSTVEMVTPPTLSPEISKCGSNGSLSTGLKQRDVAVSSNEEGNNVCIILLFVHIYSLKGYTVDP